MSALCKLSSTTNERAAEEKRKRDEGVMGERKPVRQRGISVGRVAMRQRGGGMGEEIWGECKIRRTKIRWKGRNIEREEKQRQLNNECVGSEWFRAYVGDGMITQGRKYTNLVLLYESFYQVMFTFETDPLINHAKEKWLSSLSLAKALKAY